MKKSSFKKLYKKTDMAIIKDDMVIVKKDVSVLKDDMVIVKKDVSVLKDDMVIVKKDVSCLKEQAKEFATKKDLERYATKDDLRDEIESAVELIFKHMVSKEEFYTEIQKMATKEDIQKIMMRMDDMIMSNAERFKQNEKRIERLEQYTF